MIACGAYVVRVVAYSVFTDPWLILTVEPLHGVTFAFLQLASVHYVAQLAPAGKHLRASCVLARMCVFACMCMRACVCVCLRACVHACAHVCACEGIGAPALGYRAQCSTLRTYLQYVHVCIYACMHVCIKHMYGVCAYIRICINTYMLRARDLRAEPAYMNTWTDACLY